MGRSRGQEAGRDQSGPGSAKVCPVCGRSFEWRRKWASTWDRIRYCSAGCRRGLRPHDRALEEAILELLGQRARGAAKNPVGAPFSNRRATRRAAWRARDGSRSRREGGASNPMTCAAPFACAHPRGVVGVPQRTGSGSTEAPSTRIPRGPRGISSRMDLPSRTTSIAVGTPASPSDVLERRSEGM